MISDDDILQILFDCVEHEAPLSSALENNVIHSLAGSCSSEVRIWTAKALAFETSDHLAVQVLCQLAQDTDELVRTEAIDSLCGFPCHKSYCVAETAMDDSDCHVRAYAAFAVAVIGKSVAPDRAFSVLNRLAEDETDKRALVGILEGQYLLGKDSAIDKLIALLDEADYWIQCATINALAEILNEKNLCLIESAIQKRDMLQSPAAVSDAVRRILRQCKQMR